MDVDTFLTELFVAADDFCQTDIPVRPTRGPEASLATSEVVCLACFSQWAQFRSQRAFYRYAQRRLRPLFPDLPARAQFNRLTRTAFAAIVAFSQHLAAQGQSQTDIYEALDTMGCRTRGLNRRGRGWLAGEANIGYCNRLGYYEGLNVITIVTPKGVITGFGLAPASTKEQPYAETFLAARAYQLPALCEVGPPAQGWYIADNGFCGCDRHTHWADAYGARVISPPQRYRTRHPWSKAWRRWLAGLRQIVETVHEKLLNIFRLSLDRPHHLQGFRTRLAATVCLHNFCICLNINLGRDHLAFADLIDW
jgi:hypothetical protein